MDVRAQTNGDPRRLRIAQIAPLIESVPPRMYGGTERVVSYLTEALVELGHEVTLFASGDSRTAARLIAPCPRALRLASCHDSIPHHLVMLEELARRAHEFDLVHFHVDYLHYPMTRRDGTPHVTTLHGRLDLPELVSLYREFREMPVVSISNAQREPLPWISWQTTIHHGLPTDLYHVGDGGGGYLAFVGRISPEKGVDRAIEIARRAGLPLRIAAKIDEADHEYYTQQIAPLLRQPHVELVGEICEADKQAFLGNARALLFPIQWPEPFGLVMIEALACGTPVIALRNGSVPEVLEEGVTGFICRDLDDAVVAVARLPELSRTRCRRSFENRFTATRMAADYVDVYRRQRENTHEQRIDARAPGLLDPGYETTRR